MMQRVLITGAQGFAGRYLVRELLAQHDVEAVLGVGRSEGQRTQFTHAIQRNGTPIPAPLPADLARALGDTRYSYQRVDVADTPALVETVRAFRPTVILHMASALRDDPIPKLFRVNVEGTMSLLRAIAQARVLVDRVVLGSSGGVYGIPNAVPIAERTPYAPVDTYAVSKAAAEMAALAATQNGDAGVVIARLFNLIGPGQDERHVGGRFASQLVSHARNASPVRVGDLSPTRDFIDVRDVASAVIALARRGAAAEAYNVGSGEETAIATVYELTSIAACGTYVEPELNAYARAADIPRHVADVRKLRALGHRDAFTLEQSVADLVEYYRAAADSGTGARTA